MPVNIRKNGVPKGLRCAHKLLFSPKHLSTIQKGNVCQNECHFLCQTHLTILGLISQHYSILGGTVQWTELHLEVQYWISFAQPLYANVEKLADTWDHNQPQSLLRSYMPALEVDPI